MIIFRILGIVLIIIAAILVTLSRTLVKTRLFLFHDLSMVTQYTIALIMMVLGVISLYFSGTFN
ncbi:hypothetical protein GKC32_05810 [Lactobacillus curvatus]|nr:hypothetical protein [Latilactobacillus curvatus]MSE23983.1 hypothetical protein [Latilactobacillus curvatus]